MLHKKSLYTLLFFTLSSFSFADTSAEDEIKKALENITQIKVMKSTEKIAETKKAIESTEEIKEVVNENKDKEVEKTVQKEVVKEKTTEKKVVKKAKKKYHKKKQHKKKKEKIDISKLPEVKTLGVVNVSKPFTLKNGE